MFAVMRPGLLTCFSVSMEGWASFFTLSVDSNLLIEGSLQEEVKECCYSDQSLPGVCTFECCQGFLGLRFTQDQYLTSCLAQHPDGRFEPLAFPEATRRRRVTQARKL